MKVNGKYEYFCLSALALNSRTSSCSISPTAGCRALLHPHMAGPFDLTAPVTKMLAIGRWTEKGMDKAARFSLPLADAYNIKMMKWLP
ncbi:hypothetical protein SNE25_27870 [Mucilaginibacter sabulilitoris]|uniref:Uncharacterized protein n=1 Tax=Mucilaginibacter sabulilitoris TaxID=1173583 RepID=A0ABZ0TNP3_9SPHI|nr:hypothetical protein [Mucilaginibacter sabulilitoris]WPU93140.1 hypothetical protein SNE25_27870 [Mucilaginibacter sabulilitoris]